MTCASRAAPAETQNTRVVFRLDNLVLNLLEDGAAPELVDPLAVGARDGGPRFQLTLGVADVDAACAGLGEHGVALLNGPLD